MNLQTKIPLKKAPGNLIDYQSDIVLLGSCFVENIGKKLEYFKFRNLQNPLGILFNPIVVERLISNAVEKKVYAEKDLFFHNERWHCFDAHSDMSASSKNVVLKRLNDAIIATHQHLKIASHIVVTLGTSWVYNHKESHAVVANCHKIPQKEFEKELLSVETITTSLTSIISNIRALNTEASIIFTVSPVRHLKDGFVENQQSKAHIISAIHQSLSFRLESKNLSYFPSYEIMMDELRDYRFYAEDMIHPNQTAINYIWQKVKQKWISEKSYAVMDEVESIRKGLNHRPFSPESIVNIEFRKNLVNRVKELQEKYEHIKFV